MTFPQSVFQHTKQATPSNHNLTTSPPQRTSETHTPFHPNDRHRDIHFSSSNPTTHSLLHPTASQPQYRSTPLRARYGTAPSLMIAARCGALLSRTWTWTDLIHTSNRTDVPSTGCHSRRAAICAAVSRADFSFDTRRASACWVAERVRVPEASTCLEGTEGRAVEAGEAGLPFLFFCEAGLPFLFFLGGSLAPLPSASSPDSCAVWSTERFPGRRLVLGSADVWPAGAWVGTGEAGVPLRFFLGGSLAPPSASSPKSCAVWPRARFSGWPAVRADIRALIAPTNVPPKPMGRGQWELLNLGDLGRGAYGGWSETSDFRRTRPFRAQWCDDSEKESSPQEPWNLPSHCRRLRAREEARRQWEAQRQRERPSASEVPSVWPMVRPLLTAREMVEREEGRWLKVGG